MRYSASLPADKLTLNDVGGGEIVSGGEEVGQALLRQIMPGSIPAAIDAAIERAGKRRTGDLAAGIAGTTNTRDKGYRTVARYLQRVRTGQIRDPKRIARQMERYQTAYSNNTGQPSATIDQIRRLATGEQLPRRLPRGTMIIKINGLFLRYPGGIKGGVDLRPGGIQFAIYGAKSSQQARAVVDPIGEWLREARDYINDDFEIHRIDSIEMIFDDA